MQKEIKFEIEVTATGYKTLSFTYEKKETTYKYVYAGLTWAEYWAAEGVQAAGSDAGSDETDSREESDKGAFDVVTPCDYKPWTAQRKLPVRSDYLHERWHNLMM